MMGPAGHRPPRGQSSYLRLGRQVEQDKSPPLGRVVDGEGTGDEPGDGDGWRRPLPAGVSAGGRGAG